MFQRLFKTPGNDAAVIAMFQNVHGEIRCLESKVECQQREIEELKRRLDELENPGEFRG